VGQRGGGVPVTLEPGEAELRDLVESGGHPYIKLVILPDDNVQVTAAGVEEQNVLPILALVVKAVGRGDLSRQ